MDMNWTMAVTIVGANIALIAASFGITITLFLWSRSEAREERAQTNAILNGIQQEIKDFHGRLCAIEERNRK